MGDPRKRMVGAGVLTAAVGVAAFAFTAGNTVPDSRAGDGTGDISGYVVSDVEYALDAGDPAEFDSVSFTLDAAASSVQVKVNAASSTYTACTNSSGNDWSCDLSGVSVVSADELRVIAVD